MVVFGGLNLALFLFVMAVKRYAFTSLWCAYAAVASVIILAYFWKYAKERPFAYARIFGLMTIELSSRSRHFNSPAVKAVYDSDLKVLRLDSLRQAHRTL